MNEKILRALVEAGAVRRLHVVAEGALFHVEADTQTGKVVASTLKGTPKTWGSLDAAARWARKLGIGRLQVDVTHWLPGQRALPIKGGGETIPFHDAERLAQQFVGPDKTLTTCKEIPEVLYVNGSPSDYYFFWVGDKVPGMRVGGSQCIGVFKKTGVVTDFGIVGE